jgi:Lon protease-like protein
VLQLDRVSDLLPLFPLPNVVLFPNVFLPLHVFEPRYREMVADAIDSDRLIGMVLLRPGWEHDYEGRPAVYEIGCSGVITHVEQLPDGRYNIVLRGIEKFRIVEEDHQLAYRRARIDAIADPAIAADREQLRVLRARLEALLSTPEPGAPQPSDLRVPQAMADEDLVNALAQYLDFEAIEKQALLQEHGLRARAESLVELLEMKLLSARSPGASTRSQ